MDGRWLLTDEDRDILRQAEEILRCKVRGQVNFALPAAPAPIQHTPASLNNANSLQGSAAIEDELRTWRVTNHSYSHTGHPADNAYFNYASLPPASTAAIPLDSGWVQNIPPPSCAEPFHGPTRELAIPGATGATAFEAGLSATIPKNPDVPYDGHQPIDPISYVRNETLAQNGSLLPQVLPIDSYSFPRTPVFQQEITSSHTAGGSLTGINVPSWHRANLAAAVGYSSPGLEHVSMPTAAPLPPPPSTIHNSWSPSYMPLRPTAAVPTSSTSSYTGLQLQDDGLGCSFEVELLANGGVSTAGSNRNYSPPNQIWLSQDHLDGNQHLQGTRGVPVKGKKPKKPTGKRNSPKQPLQYTYNRQRGPCVKCRHNHVPCIEDPANPHGPCLRCRDLTFNVFRLPCVRCKISVVVLFRTASNLSYESEYPLVGFNYGRFETPKHWVSTKTKVIRILQVEGAPLQITVREFRPPDLDLTDSKGHNSKGRKLYAVPWAMVDSSKALQQIQKFVLDSIPLYIQRAMADEYAHHQFTFIEAQRHASHPTYGTLVTNALKLCTGCRFIEGGWRIDGAETLGAENLPNPFRPSGWVSPPPYVDYEFASLVIEKLLVPLRKSVLSELQKLVHANKPEHWFPLLLVIFVLLHSYELVISHEVEYAAKREMAVKFVDPKLIEQIEHGARILLTHFRVINKGHIPFERGFNWTSDKNKKMAALNDHELVFVTRLSSEVELLRSSGEEIQYGIKHPFTSQLFIDREII